MFAHDRDLPALEPNLFRDFAWLGQVLASGTANSPGWGLELDSDPTLEDRDVRAGHVVMVDGVPLEVLERTGATELDVSLVRPRRADAPLPPGKIENRPAYVATFAPQIEMAHRALLRLYGLEAARAGAVLNAGELAPVEAFGALHLIFAAGAGGSAERSPLWRRAEAYRRRFAHACRRVPMVLDLDGDGAADAVRRAGSVPLVRG